MVLFGAANWHSPYRNCGQSVRVHLPLVCVRCNRKCDLSSSTSGEVAKTSVPLRGGTMRNGVPKPKPRMDESKSRRLRNLTALLPIHFMNSAYAPTDA